MHAAILLLLLPLLSSGEIGQFFATDGQFCMQSYGHSAGRFGKYLVVSMLCPSGTRSTVLVSSYSIAPGRPPALVDSRTVLTGSTSALSGLKLLAVGDSLGWLAVFGTSKLFM